MFWLHSLSFHSETLNHIIFWASTPTSPSSRTAQGDPLPPLHHTRTHIHTHIPPPPPPCVYHPRRSTIGHRDERVPLIPLNFPWFSAPLSPADLWHHLNMQMSTYSISPCSDAPLTRGPASLTRLLLMNTLRLHSLRNRRVCGRFCWCPFVMRACTSVHRENTANAQMWGVNEG